jgi:TPP-dependent trihydroxycyclohexane-1,2-dione (THcHDO) dehydratase
MEGTKRKSNRVLMVERGFEWSRLEEQVMASAYEHVLPIIRAVPGKSLTQQAKADSSGGDGATGDRQRHATGA